MAKKIFYAEDEPGISEALKGLLEKAGYQVMLCENGREVLPGVSAFEPDLIILDMMMPGLDGLQIVSRLSVSEKFSATPVIATTALAHLKKDLDNYPQVRHFIVKPFSATTLIQAVKEVLAPPPQAAPPKH